MTGAISKKAPGDRQISFEEIGTIAALISRLDSEGKVSDFPETCLKEILSLLREAPLPPLLSRIAPSAAKGIGKRVARTLSSKEILLKVVDLGDGTGFPRENARPACEVLLVKKGSELLWLGKKKLLADEGTVPVIFVTAAFVSKNRNRPTVLLQAILHPVIEWFFSLPHIVAVLCESAYNAVPSGDEAVSDLNRFIVAEAGKDKDLRYFDRILGTEYEPDEFRMEELRACFGQDEGKIAEVVSLARSMGRGYRELVETTLAETREDLAREQVAKARESLDEGDADRALQGLRKLVVSGAVSRKLREEADALVALAIESLAHDADPAYEGLSMEGGAIRIEPWAGRKARAFADLLSASTDCVRGQLEGRSRADGERGEVAPLGVKSPPRTIHVITDLERPSAKFIDGHDHVHWVFEKSFIEALLGGWSGEPVGGSIPAILACRFVRDDAFPDEKLPLDRQFSAAVKGAIEGYRFYQGLPARVRAGMSDFYEGTGVADRLYRLFVSLGSETNPARASHAIRDAVARTHSYNYVRFPDTSMAGQVVVITGGGTGMGRAIALEAAKAGANVVITGRRPEPLVETKADLDDLIAHLGLTNRTLAVQGNVGDPKYVGEMFARIEGELGRIDVLYNNAGVSGPVEFGSVYREEHFEQYQEAVHVHLTGAWLASLEAARIMESQAGGGTIVMVGTFYSESVHRHVLHAYPGRLPYTSAQSAKLALGDYLAWALSVKNITVLSLNPSAVATERIRKGSGVFDKGSKARARIGRVVSPEALEKDTLERTVSREFVIPRDFARVALEIQRVPFRRTVGGQRIPMGGVTYEQPPGVIPSPAAMGRYPDMVGKVALVTLHRPLGNDLPLLESAVKALARSGASVVLAGDRIRDMERIAAAANAARGEGMVTVSPASLANMAEVQGLFDGLPRLDLLLHFTGSVDWKRPLANIPFEEWSAAVEQFGFVPRLLCWQSERKMDGRGADGTILIVGPDMSGVPSIRERNLVQVFQAMLRPAVATESMERGLMRKAQADGKAPSGVSDVNICLILPGRTDGRNRHANPEATSATILWLLDEGKAVSGAVLLPDEQNSVARLPGEPKESSGTMTGKVVVVTGGIRNLGKEISLRFAGEKGIVVAASRRPNPAVGNPEDRLKAAAELSAADAVLARMRALGSRSLWIDADVSRPRRVRAVIEETVNRFGRVDAFVNNAGAGGDFSFLEDVMREHRQSWDSVLRANFLGPWTATAQLREVMRKQPDGGVIVNVSTHYADHPYLFRTIYTVSKIMLKALSSSLRASLGRDNIRISDVAPTLIAGPRMDWVMRNYATKFADQFVAFRGLRPAERNALQELFIRSFDRALPSGERDGARTSFLAMISDTALPKPRRAAMEDWYANAAEWFRATVPDSPPTNEEVAEAVLFAAKNARFLEDPFIGVSTLGGFSTFPPLQSPARRGFAGESFAILSLGHERTEVFPTLADELRDAGARVVSMSESPRSPGNVAIERPAPGGARGKKKSVVEKLARDMNLSDPRVVEPWLDNSLLGEPAPSGAVLGVGTFGGGKPLLDFSPEEMESFLDHVGKALNLFAESLRAVKEDGHVVVVGPSRETDEGAVLLAALRQMVRTSIAERHFLPERKKIRLSLLAPSGKGKEDMSARVAGILGGKAPPFVEPIPVGRPRS